MTPGKTTKKLLIGGVFSIAMLMNAACADSGNDDQAEDAQSPASAQRPQPMSKEERLAMRERLQDAKQVEKVPQEELEPATAGAVGEVPTDLLDKIYADLERQAGAQRSDFKILMAEEKQWNDGALGCPEPGQAYTQAIVDGYQVIIEHDGESFDYHASRSGFFKLCSGFRPNR